MSDDYSKIREMATTTSNIASEIQVLAEKKNNRPMMNEAMRIREAATKITTMAMKWKAIEEMKLGRK